MHRKELRMQMIYTESLEHQAGPTNIIERCIDLLSNFL